MARDPECILFRSNGIGNKPRKAGYAKAVLSVFSAMTVTMAVGPPAPMKFRGAAWPTTCSDVRATCEWTPGHSAVGETYPELCMNPCREYVTCPACDLHNNSGTALIFLLLCAPIAQPVPRRPTPGLHPGRPAGFREGQARAAAMPGTGRTWPAGFGGNRPETLKWMYACDPPA